MKIKNFGVEIWMNETENHCEYNLAETCVDSLTVEELLDLAGKKDALLDEILPMRLSYGAIEGSDRLRDVIASLYRNQSRENIVITHGAIGANMLVHASLVSPGDRVISVVPTYQQHYSIPESFGADIQLLQLHEENGFLPDLTELQSLVNDNTRLICITNPNNPTGALIDESMLLQIADIARRCDAHILCDEVYRGTDQQGDGMTASMADLYEKGISTASMSKAYSLAGLRLGWIAGPRELLEAVSIHRDYNTISVGMIDDHLASIALENSEAILNRSREITRNNLAVLDAWVENEPLISYVKPQSGTTALLKYDVDMSSRKFCLKLLAETGVLFTPGSAMEMEGYLRIGYANHPDILKKGLQRVSGFLQRLGSE
jgi:aspartate/methionine/tyrosine aminotransferase